MKVEVEKVCMVNANSRAEREGYGVKVDAVDLRVATRAEAVVLKQRIEKALAGAKPITA